MSEFETVWVVRDGMGYMASKMFDTEAEAQLMADRMTVIGIEGLTVIEVLA